MSNPSVGDKARYAAERVMEPILRRWFEIDLEPVNLDSNAENAAVDLSWALESAGLLLPIELVVPEERAPTQTKVGDQVDWRAMALRRAAPAPAEPRGGEVTGKMPTGWAIESLASTGDPNVLAATLYRLVPTDAPEEGP